MHDIGSSLLSRLLDEHGDALVLYAQQWCYIPEDVVQEAFIRLMRQRPPPENIVGWLYRVVRNEAISSSRAEARRVHHESLVNSEPWFVAAYGNRLDADAAAAALASLSIEQRETIVLRLWSGLTFDQIAELTGKSTSTAHRRYESGIAALRKKWSIPCLNRENESP